MTRVDRSLLATRLMKPTRTWRVLSFSTGNVGPDTALCLFSVSDHPKKPDTIPAGFRVEILTRKRSEQREHNTERDIGARAPRLAHPTVPPALPPWFSRDRDRGSGGNLLFIKTFRENFARKIYDHPASRDGAHIRDFEAARHRGGRVSLCTAITFPSSFGK